MPNRGEKQSIAELTALVAQRVTPAPTIVNGIVFTEFQPLLTILPNGEIGLHEAEERRMMDSKVLSLGPAVEKFYKRFTKAYICDMQMHIQIAQSLDGSALGLLQWRDSNFKKDDGEYAFGGYKKRLWKQFKQHYKVLKQHQQQREEVRKGEMVKQNAQVKTENISSPQFLEIQQYPDVEAEKERDQNSTRLDSGMNDTGFVPLSTQQFNETAPTLVDMQFTDFEPSLTILPNSETGARQSDKQPGHSRPGNFQDSPLASSIQFPKSRKVSKYLRFTPHDTRDIGNKIKSGSSIDQSRATQLKYSDSKFQKNGGTWSSWREYKQGLLSRIQEHYGRLVNQAEAEGLLGAQEARTLRREVNQKSKCRLGSGFNMKEAVGKDNASVQVATGSMAEISDDSMMGMGDIGFNAGIDCNDSQSNEIVSLGQDMRSDRMKFYNEAEAPRMRIIYRGGEFVVDTVSQNSTLLKERQTVSENLPQDHNGGPMVTSPGEIASSPIAVVNTPVSPIKEPTFEDEAKLDAADPIEIDGQSFGAGNDLEDERWLGDQLLELLETQ